MAMRDLNGKRILITGAASGIGRDVVERAIQNSIPLHPDLAGLRVLLDTDNAQGLYSRFGFRAVDASQVMERLGLT